MNSKCYMNRPIALLLVGALSLSLVACKNSRGEKKPGADTEDTYKTITHVHRTEPTSSKSKLPKRVILMIGDGMGTPVISSAAYARGERLEMLQMPTISFMRTHEHEFVTTDSAASATAMATGSKTHYEGVSVKPGTAATEEQDPASHLESLVSVARQQGLRTGLVATSRIVHATPAAFASHRANRSSYEEIALDMSTSQIDVLLGAGTQYFTKRKDGRNLLDEMQSAHNYRVADSPDKLSQFSNARSFQPTIGLFHDKDMPPVSSGGRAISLAQMTDEAIALLDQDNPGGFFLMVEGSQIDWEEHAMNGAGAIAETLDFDAAVGVARRYASQREDTLVIVTADHETGGFATMDPATLERPLELLGGAVKANLLTQGKREDEFPLPVDFIPLGQPANPSLSLETAPLLEDRRLATAFGFLSIASRKGWDKQTQGFFSAMHTLTMVPIFAQGASHELISGVHDNADLGQFIKRLLRAQDAEGLTKASEARGAALSGSPKNVILIIGDGMGLSAMSATEYTHGLSSLSLPVQGLVATHGANRLVNDSAATATALATGHLAMYRSVGMRPVQGDGADASTTRLIPSVTVLEEAERTGRRTGLITTTTLTHATPASFYAHHEDRKQEGEIASFFTSLPDRIEGSDGIDVAFAGGSKYLSAAQVEELAARGVIFQKSWSDALPERQGDRPTQLVRLMSEGPLDDAPTRLAGKGNAPTLAAMTGQALEVLSEGDRGFFLMVEGGQIDWALHALETGPRVLDEIHDLDEAVRVAVAFAEERGDTLVIVTADHDHTLSVIDNHYGFESGQCSAAKKCGGEVSLEEIPIRDAAMIHRGEGLSSKALQGEGFDHPSIILQYAWPVQAASLVKHQPGPHSANFVPLFAYGPGSATLGGFHLQPEVGQILLQWASSPRE